MRLLCVILQLVAVFTSVSAWSVLPQLHDRHIIGGSDARSELLHQVSLTKNGKHLCGGAVLSDQTVLTAAHCLYGEDPSKIVVCAGSINREQCTVYTIDPKSVKFVGCYNNETRDCDIALFKVKEKVIKNVNQLRLTKNEPYDGSLLTVTGWGLTEVNGALPKILRQVKIKKVNRLDCQTKYQDINKITKNMICAGDENKNICQGDSGGPLFDDNRTLVGIVAWGVQDSEHTRCSPNYPGVFTNIASPDISSFINQHL